MLKKNEIRNKAARPAENKAKPKPEPKPEKSEKDGGNAYIVTSDLATLESGGQGYFLAFGQILVSPHPVEVKTGQVCLVAGLPKLAEPALSLPASDAGTHVESDGVGFQPMIDAPGLMAAMLFLPFGAKGFGIKSTLGRFFRHSSDYEPISAVYLSPKAMIGLSVEKIGQEIDLEGTDARIIVFMRGKDGSKKTTG